jgi:hypothetical protein
MDAVAAYRWRGAFDGRLAYGTDPIITLKEPDMSNAEMQREPAVTARLTGHIEAADTSFTTELTNAVRRAAAAQPLPDDELKIVMREADKEDKVAV